MFITITGNFIKWNVKVMPNYIPSQVNTNNEIFKENRNCLSDWIMKLQL